MESSSDSNAPDMVKPRQLPNGKWVDTRQSFSNLPSSNHWLFRHLWEHECNDVLWGRESLPVWNIISDYGSNLKKTLSKTGGGFVDKYIAVCHKAIFDRANRRDISLLLYKLYCHVQYMDTEKPHWD